MRFNDEVAFALWMQLRPMAARAGVDVADDALFVEPPLTTLKRTIDQIGGRAS
jgi:hypothetical protein